MLPAQAQNNRNKPKNSDQKGTLYFYWGYNRSAYTKTNLHFTGPGYDFTFEGAKARDRQEKQFVTYVNPVTLTIPQFNMRLGYNFRRSEELRIVDQRNFSGLSFGIGIKLNKMRFSYSHARYNGASNTSFFGLQIDLR